MAKNSVIKSLDKMQQKYNKLKIAIDGLEEIINMSEGSQEYNASQFKWAKIFAEATLDKIIK